MLGKNHRKINLMALLPINLYLYNHYHEYVKLFLSREIDTVIPTLSLAFIVYYISSNLPDIDRNKFIPIKHRTWTHSIRLILITSYTSFKHIDTHMNLSLIGLSFSSSYLLHILVDCFSDQGCKILYPLIDRKILNIKLYKTGKKSEKIFANIIILIMILGSLYITMQML